MDNFRNKGLGFIESKPDPRDFVFGATYGTETFPASYQTDISKIKVHDQGRFQNCGTHALSAHVEIALEKSKKYQNISFPWYYGDRRYTEHKGEGTEARGLLKAAQKDGGLYLADYPFEEEIPKAIETFEKNYEKFKNKAQNIRIKNYYQCYTVDEIKRAVYYYGSALVGTIIFNSFYKISAENPVMSEPIISNNSLEPMQGGHMMLIVGWNELGFVVLNSWGKSFGNKGLFTMPYSLMTWSARNDFPLSLFEAWAIDGIYFNGELLNANIPIVNPVASDGWYKQDGQWRYKENGKDVIGWKKVNNVWYYLKPDGYMAKGWIKDNGKWYFLKSNGAMATGWLLEKKEWYYLNEKGEMITGWQKIGGNWYYFDLKTGKAYRGLHTIAGKDYYFIEKQIGDLKECQMIKTDSSGAIIP